MSWLTVGRRWFDRLQRWIGFLLIGDQGYEFLPGPQLPPVARPVPPSAPACEVCQEPSTGLRTHDGHWRCARHKGVSCDVCGRALPVLSLPDHSWRCAIHG